MLKWLSLFKSIQSLEHILLGSVEPELNQNWII